jgi:hypothetical protein
MFQKNESERMAGTEAVGWGRGHGGIPGKIEYGFYFIEGQGEEVGKCIWTKRFAQEDPKVLASEENGGKSLD